MQRCGILLRAPGFARSGQRLGVGIGEKPRRDTAQLAQPLAAPGEEGP